MHHPTAAPALQRCNPFGGTDSCMALPEDSQFASICQEHDLMVGTPANLVHNSPSQNSTCCQNPCSGACIVKLGPSVRGAHTHKLTTCTMRCAG